MTRHSQRDTPGKMARRHDPPSDVLSSLRSRKC